MVQMILNFKMTKECKNRKEVETFLAREAFRPSYKEFSREAITVEKKRDFPSTESSFDAESDETPRGNPLWTRIKSDYRSKIKSAYEKFNMKRIDCPYMKETFEIQESLFPILLPGLVECLTQAQIKGILNHRTRYKFDPVDFIAEYMFNQERNHQNIFEIDTFRKILEQNPRPYEPKSWSWSRNDAAVVIQKNVRGWLVRKTPLVAELRGFWKVLTRPGISSFETYGKPNQTELPIMRNVPPLTYEEALKLKLEQKQKNQTEEANQERLKKQLRIIAEKSEKRA